MNHFLAEEWSELEGRLSAEDSHHALRVLRLQVGKAISVSPGDGRVFSAEIIASPDKSCRFKVGPLLRTEKRPQVSIAIAPTKSNDRFEWFLEKATEFGVADIYPVICSHSERKIYKTDRGRKVIKAAFKQSKKGFMPELHPTLNLKDFLKQVEVRNKYIAHLNDGKSLSLNEVEFNAEGVFLIGPEGDFRPEEVEEALSAGYQALSLGSEVLRTETAGVQISALANWFRQ